MRLAAAATLFLILLHPVRGSDLDANALIQRLAKPAPATIDFKEWRFSALLEEPLVVSGELRYLAADHLERFVQQPYREKTIIRGESVRVERHGEKLRTFALKRAPELKGLLSAFGALLTGDGSALEKDFEISAGGDAERWELTLVPRDTRARQHVAQLIVTGAANEPSCLMMGKAGESQSVMLFANSAQGEMPSDMSPTGVSFQQLESICRSELPAK
jgi:hypothetical protein